MPLYLPPDFDKLFTETFELLSSASESSITTQFTMSSISIIFLLRHFGFNFFSRDETISIAAIASSKQKLFASKTFLSSSLPCPGNCFISFTKSSSLSKSEQWTLFYVQVSH